MSFLKGSKYKSWVSTDLLTQNVLLGFRLDLLNTIIGILPLRLEIRSMTSGFLVSTLSSQRVILFYTTDLR